MRNIFVFLFLVSPLFAYPQMSVPEWGPDKEAEHVANRENPQTWDYRLLEQDIAEKENLLNKPLDFGAFPVPQYGLIGENTFDGIMCGNYYIPFGDKGHNLLWACLGVNRNGMIQKYIGDKEDEVFFTVVVLTDQEIASDEDFWNNVESDVHMSSRNNPDYLGQGYIKTKNDEIDFVAFLTANRDEYAVVNMRLFDLKHGRIVFIAPQKDGSLRSMQVRTEEIVSSPELNVCLAELIAREDIKAFLEDDNNI